MYDINWVREQFPALKREEAGRSAVFFDAPGGTQMPQRVLDKVTEYLVHTNSNSGGVFSLSRENDEMIQQTRAAFADFFNCSWDEVSFCHNSTTISYKLSHAIARELQPGDEIILTDIDHEANRSPWTILEERGFIIKSVRVNPDTCTLDLEDYKNKLSPKTRVVAFNYASNAVGTINPAAEIVALAKKVGAITITDAVHYALHGVIDVKALDIDFLFCSAYKFFGPHVGILYAKKARMNSLKTLSVKPQKQEAPYKFETGTLNHEGISGAGEALEFIADLGRKHEANTALARREALIAGMNAIDEYEQELTAYFKRELAKTDNVIIYNPPADHPATSTISLRIKNTPPKEIAQKLADKGIFTWAGNFYAVNLVETLGFQDNGGLLRIGLAPYNTREEIDYCLKRIREIA